MENSNKNKPKRIFLVIVTGSLFSLVGCKSVSEVVVKAGGPLAGRMGWGGGLDCHLRKDEYLKRAFTI